VARADEYLAGAGTATTANTGDLPSMQLNIAKLMVATGVIGPVRPDRAVRQLNSLAKFGFNLGGGYAAARAHSPEGIAIVDDYGSHTFADVHHGSDRIAAGLHRLHIREGAAVGILARNHAAMIYAVVACGRLGVDIALFNTGMSGTQIADTVQRNHISAVILDDEFDELVRELPPHVIRISTHGESVFPSRVTLAELGSGDDDYPLPDKPGRQIVLTAGTTGAPKAALRPRPKGFATIAAMLSKLPLTEGERILIAAPLFHSWGFGILQISTPIRATVILQDRFDPTACLAAIHTHRATSLIAVPIMLQRLLDLPPATRARYNTTTLRSIASCGSPLPGHLALDIMNTYGDILYNFYGSTEVSWATIATPTDLRTAPATAGHPPLGTHIAILDHTGHPMPIGAVGRIHVGNDMLFDGYTNATNPPTTGHLMDTGDLGYLDADQRLFISGRTDDMIISGGENVFPRPVEDALAQLPQIHEVAVIGVPDHEYGQRLAAFVVPHHGATIDTDTLRTYIRTRLNKFSVPRDILLLDALPRSTTGKILKRILAQGVA
jgi:acyl-CoA synthetase (AMP-forming)/AMP-acid ligase II